MPFACESILTSLPPAGCGGVPVTGSDLRRLPGISRVGKTWWTTRAFVLVGDWDGHVLTLTHRPFPGRATPEPPQPARCTGRATPAIRALSRTITNHAARIHLLQLSPCGDRVWVLAAVADRRTVEYIRHRFGHKVIVTGWLRRR